MAVRLHVEDDSQAGPAQKRVRLSLSPNALRRQTDLEAEVFKPILTVTPELFDATPSDATGLAGRRKSSRSRVYSQQSSAKGSCALLLWPLLAVHPMSKYFVQQARVKKGGQQGQLIMLVRVDIVFIYMTLLSSQHSTKMPRAGRSDAGTSPEFPLELPDLILPLGELDNNSFAQDCQPMQADIASPDSPQPRPSLPNLKAIATEEELMSLGNDEEKENKLHGWQSQHDARFNTIEVHNKSLRGAYAIAVNK